MRSRWFCSVRRASWLSNQKSSRTTTRKVGFFGLENLNEPQDFIKLGEQAIEECKRLKHAIVSNHASLRTIQDLDAISNAVCGVVDAAELCRNVHPDE
jgi:intermediate peptidase